MKTNQQQKVADVLVQNTDAYFTGALNAYELAGRLIAAVHENEVDELTQSTDQHDCINDEFASGNCPHPVHYYELVDQQRPQTSHLTQP